LNRHPDGITGESFYQKDITNAPDWVKTVPIYSESEKKTMHWLICNDKDTLLYMANLGCIEMNPWSSRIHKKKYADYLIIDLDPYAVDFTEVITTARMVKKVIDQAKMDSFIKTSGKTGLHILVPLGAKYTFDQTRQFAELLATIVSQKLPHTTSVTRNPQKREKKVYIDFLQNRFAQTIAAPYSLRPIPGAHISTPIHWSELTETLDPSDFTLKNIFKRLNKTGDIWKGLLAHKGINMRKSLELLQK
jgi:bifunctional non-homologous end joining protein LigD